MKTGGTCMKGRLKQAYLNKIVTSLGIKKRTATYGKRQSIFRRHHPYIASATRTKGISLHDRKFTIQQLATWQFGNLAIWPLGNLAIWQFGHLAIWQFGKLATQQISESNTELTLNFGNFQLWPPSKLATFIVGNFQTWQLSIHQNC